MLVKDFYQILSRENSGDSNYKIEVRLNPECEVYKGHFPGQPVAPGVCLTQMVKELCNEIIGKELRLSEAQQIKFLAMIDPQKIDILTVDLHITHTTENGNYRVKCLARDDTNSYFKLSGTLV